MTNHNLYSEFDSSQNPALGAVLLDRFAREYQKHHPAGEPPSLPYLMPVLALLFNTETVEGLYRRRFAGGLQRAVADNRTLTVGLRHRVVAMASQTYEALSLAFAAGLLELDPTDGTVRSTSTVAPIGNDDAVLKMNKAANRLGRWFSGLSLHELCVLLDITF